eukprot:scaffold5122_cov60-Attheya_sp.AAC.2
MEQRLEKKIQRAVERLVELKINFLALDFDQTILDIHTGGVWKGTVSDLATHVRPTFECLIPAVHEAGIQMAIVTFSPQVRHIQELMEGTFPSAIADSIPIRGRDRSWSYEGRGSKSGKQCHIASAVEELSARHPHLEITKRTTLLIDDDANNIRIALKDGVRGLWLNPKDPDKFLNNMLDLI